VRTLASRLNCDVGLASVIPGPASILRVRTMHAVAAKAGANLASARAPLPYPGSEIRRQAGVRYWLRITIRWWASWHS